MNSLPTMPLKLIVWASILLVTGCATQIRPPAGGPMPASVKFALFDSVVMKHVDINSKLAGSSANRAAVKKIDEHLFTKMRHVLKDLRDGDAAAPVVAASGRPLLITPHVSDIKFIGGAARFWVGPLAGSSAVRMKVTYTDLRSNAVVAEPEFYAQANAFAGSFTFGAMDNLMLERIANEIVDYTRLNQ